MSIATVRIAPIERWCEWYTGRLTEKMRPIAQKMVGHELEILTESMRPASCNPDARLWDITSKSADWLKEVGAKPSNFGGICEHMLEMD